MTQNLTDKVKSLFFACQKKGLMVATAESCTGGLVAAALTDVEGSSAVFERGFVTYSNQAKTELLQVPEGIIESNGAVSEPVAVAMADGALKASKADVAVSITGIAGSGGGTAEKPVGLVYIAVSDRYGKTLCRQYHFKGNRQQVRSEAASAAIDMLQSRVDTISSGVDNQG